MAGETIIIMPWMVVGTLCGAEAERLLCEAFFPRRGGENHLLVWRLCWYGFALAGLALPYAYMLRSFWEMAGLYFYCSKVCQGGRSRRFFVVVTLCSLRQVIGWCGEFFLTAATISCRGRWLYTLLVIGFYGGSVVCAWMVRWYHPPLPDTKTWVWLPATAFFPLLTLLVLGAVWAGGETMPLWMFSLLLLVILDVASLLLLDHLEFVAKEHEQLLVAGERVRIQEANLEALSQAYTAQRKMTHDFRAHLDTLEGMAKQENLAAVRQYLEQLRGRQTERILLVNSHHAAVDAILNQKGYAAQRQGIDMRFQVNDLSALKLPGVDLAVVLGNLLDNAMEACAALPRRERWVECKLLYDSTSGPSSLYLSVVNPSLPVKMPGIRRTPRVREPALHGFGMGNVADILKRYGAEYVCSYADGCFTYSAEWPDCPEPAEKTETT